MRKKEQDVVVEQLVKWKKTGFKTALITGDKDIHWRQSTINKQIAKLVNLENFTDEGYVITGTSREVERMVLRSCKKYNIRCLTYSANFEKFGGASAEQLRNADVLQTFKPEKVIVFSFSLVNEDAENGDSVLQHLKKITKKRKMLYIEVYK